jgi:uncharacterized membrane protein
VGAAAEADVIRLAAPEALLLVPLALLFLRGRLWPRPTVGVLRVLVLVLAALLLAGPTGPIGEPGRDVVLLFDRSRSMPENASAEAREFVRGLAAQRRPGDRLGVVGFGKKAVAEVLPGGLFVWPEAVDAVDPDGSDLAAALLTAASLVDVERRGSILVVSDGEHTGEDPATAARLLQRRGLRADVVFVPRPVGRDAAVVELRSPAEVPVDAPFVLRGRVRSSHATAARYRLLRDGAVALEGECALRAGDNVLELPQLATTPGEHGYVLEVVVPGDAVPANDRAGSVVRATARPRVLCVTPGGRRDRLTAALASAGLDVEVHAPAGAPLSLAALDRFAVVVLENVPASDLAPGALGALQAWVRELGGGLLMTGGHQSFGNGGYRRSPVEDVLPVSLEVREEQRRFGLALAVALDRSGSMRMAVGNETKMDLANRGARAAVEQLSPIDAASVLAVDTQAHVIVPMTSLAQRGEILARLEGIESGGGGIYVGEAIAAAAAQLRAATQRNKHLVLFADADDAEEPGDFGTVVPALVAEGITVSVIGLGGEDGSDAALLRDIASLGGGRVQFVADAQELPRVFAQEAIQVTRSAVVEQVTPVSVRPPLAALGLAAPTVPDVGGYVVAWPRERAEQALVSADEFSVPLLSHWQVGLGRAAALLTEVDGPLTGAWAEWSEQGTLLAGVVRWLGSGRGDDVFVAVARDGDQAVYTVEVPAARAAELDGLVGRWIAPSGRAGALAFVPGPAGRATARLPLDELGVFRGALQVGGDVLRLPPIERSYGAEWALAADPRAGERSLQQLAAATGGRVGPDAAQVLAGPVEPPGDVDLGWIVGLALLFVWLAEIAVRRLDVRWTWWQRRRRRAAAVPATDAPAAAAPSAPPPPAAPAGPAGPAASGDDLLDALARAQRRGSRRV